MSQRVQINMAVFYLLPISEKVTYVHWYFTVNADALGLVRRADGWTPGDAHPRAASDRHPRATQHAPTEHAPAEHAVATRDHGAIRSSAATTPK